MGLWGVLCFLIFMGKSWGQEQTYVISAPKVFCVGASETVVIQVYGYTEAFDATISIKSYPDKKISYSSEYVSLTPENKFQNSATLTIQPKQLPGGQNAASYVYLEVVSKHFSKSKKIPITYDNGFLIIHTDKPIYTPHQSVKVRVYSLNDDLKPAKRETVLTFIDPEGSEIDMVEETDYTGIVSFPDFKIPSNPKYGVWTITAKYKEDFSTTGTAYFEVKEYVLPQFTILIEPESNFIGFKNFKNFEITIKARYFYNKVVSDAEVFIFFGIREDLQNDQKEMMHKAMMSTMLTDGIAQVTFDSEAAIKELSYNSLEELNNKYLYIAVTVTESTGGFSEEAEVPGIKYVLSPYTLNLVATPLFLKPGIPYSIKVQVKDTLDQFVGGIPVTLNAQTVDVNQETSDLESKESITRLSDGVASFVVNLPSGVTALNFDVNTNTPDLPEENQASKTFQAVAYSSLSQSYLYIDWTENYKALLVGQHLNLLVTPRSPYIDKITHYNYLILSKGKIVHFGTREKLSDSSYQSINIPVTQNMVPSARLLVYYIITGEQTAELVSDSVWLNIEEKCGNQLQVRLFPDVDAYSPGQSVSLSMETESHSWVALTAVDSAVYSVQRTTKKPMERVFQAFEKSDLGCGAGGGRNNADVFRLAGLTFLTNANADDSQESDVPCKEILRPKRTLLEKINKAAAKYKHKMIKDCCYHGAHLNKDESCEQRAARITIGPKCVKAFNECCIIATEFRANMSHKNIQLGRLHTMPLLPVSKPEVRSYFPESWLWEVHHVSRRSQLQLVLPDSLTTWEIQGVGISDSGLCVADTLKAKVFKDVFLEMNIPYSVVRGEQIQLKGTVYNYRTSGMMFCVKMSAVEGICTSENPGTERQGRRPPACVRQRVEGSSTHLVTFSVLPLETGLHSINFSLETPFGGETLVKTLRVVPEGVKRESHAGVTLDPKGIYGVISRRKEFPYRIPLDLVPKTNVQRILSVKGLLIGEVLSAVLSQEGINILTHLPKGSAEAELMSVAPVFYVFHYLETGNHWNIFSDSHTKKQNLKKKMKEGIVSILSYRNADHSYSMWKGASASTWLTAFALRVLGQVNKYVEQNKNSICNSLYWLIENCQLENGSFRENSNYQPIKLQGTLPEEARKNSLYLTAFTVIGIRKAYDICPLVKVSTALMKAENFLLENSLQAKSTFTLAIAAYALSLGDRTHSQFRSIASTLKRAALVKGGNPPVYRFWKDGLQQNKETSTPNAGTAGMVETTAYALLTYLNLKEMNYVNPIIKWLTEEQRYGGGFYSTQDTINAIEGLTEYSLLTKQLQLNMDINVSYKNKGNFQHYKMTEKNFLGRPVEVPLDDDLVISTGHSNGLATVHVTTIFHKTSTSEEICSFHLKIDTQDIEASHYNGYSKLGYKRIIACASYKANKEDSPSGSSHAVMDISLPTGISANQDDLKALVEGVDQLLTDYQIKDGHVILQVNSIPSSDFLCVRFRIFELFQVGYLSPATFTVYEYHRPDKHCTMFYSTSYSKFQRICEGAMCQCVEADCGQMKEELDLTISANTRRETACKPEIAYAYKVSVTSITEENAFIKYTATLLDVYKTGEAVAQKGSEITFIKKTTCANADLVKGRQYLLMGKEALRIKYNFNIKYIYPLDSSTWIEYWPTETACSSCQTFLATLEEFAEDIFLNGCENA